LFEILGDETDSPTRPQHIEDWQATRDDLNTGDGGLRDCSFFCAPASPRGAVGALMSFRYSTRKKGSLGPPGPFNSLI
jgi:hypothetical protein